ncbi:GID complex subunit containing RING finger motif [Recurvomyces mirabilis]|uniref:GID complex subunit containing RING finger motif n=1 Tax=Recurvomyces mirabilis TaxID=574656 RepID=A0AAE0WKH1_9PEZI|nr:GID complex subunit containing RING finger motif [Recurvomyces mirabilis]KAK5151495.1 GID complex subunit containing RING finger motif [Recurvomyces mirabilis]
MTEVTLSKLDTDSHLILDQPLLRLPHELLRKNLKSAQRQIEVSHKAIDSSLDPVKPSSRPADTLAALDATLAKAQTLKRKLEALHEEERNLHRQQKARIAHLQDLHDVQSVGDVKFDDWSEVRLDRLLVDYLLRQGYTSSARALASAKNVEDLVDISVFEESSRVEAALRGGDVKEALAWCGENKQALKKISSNLELELRLQQFIALRRTGEMGKLTEALVHARKHLGGGQDLEFGLKAGGLLAHPPDTMVEPYATIYSSTRSDYLATLFLQTHHTLFLLPSQPLLHTALSAGLSALKTPTCHSLHNPNRGRSHLSSSIATLTGSPLCPICSTELNELARGVPYAHHTKSFVEEDLVVLPNDRVFGRERLRALCEKLGVPLGKIRDPTEGLRGTEWGEGELRKVYIS